MTKKMYIHWDSEGDFLEVRFSKPVPSYYEEIGDDLFERRDEKTGKVFGYAFFNVQKRKNKSIQDLTIDLPLEISSTTSS